MTDTEKALIDALGKNMEIVKEWREIIIESAAIWKGDEPDPRSIDTPEEIKDLAKMDEALFLGEAAIDKANPEPEDISQTIARAPAAWASALVNGDQSGLTSEEAAVMNRWRRAREEEGWEVVSTEGESHFTWAFRLYGGTAEGGEVLDYTLMRKR